MSLLSKLRWSFKKRKLEVEVEDELRFHLDMRARGLAAEGVPSEGARAAAMRRFGNRSRVAERCRERDTFAWIESAAQDVRFGLRMLRRTPGVTLVALLSLALGIGANTAIFSLMDAVMFRDLPVGRAQQLFLLQWHAQDSPRQVLRSLDGWSSHVNGMTSTSFSYPFFERLRESASGTAEFFGFTSRDEVNLIAGGQAQIVEAQAVSGNFFTALGVGAAAGRALVDSDDRDTAAPAAVISYACWERRFGRDPAIAGQRIAINRVPFTVVGVAPRGFFGVSPGRGPDLWFPLRALTVVSPERPDRPRLRRFQSTDYWWVMVMARLQWHEARAASAINAVLSAHLSGGRVLPRNTIVPTATLVPARSGIGELRSQVAAPLLVLMSLAALVLLIACANIAGLLLARASARQRETAIRLALGAGRARLIRQYLTESLLLAAGGGLLGIAVARWAAHGLVRFAVTGSVPRELAGNPDLRVLAFTAAIATLTGLLFGLAPAFRSARLDVTPALKENSRGLRDRRGKLPLGKALVAGQVALSLVLVISAALFVRTLVNLRAIDVGLTGTACCSSAWTRRPTATGRRNWPPCTAMSSAAWRPSLVSVPRALRNIR